MPHFVGVCSAQVSTRQLVEVPRRAQDVEARVVDVREERRSVILKLSRSECCGVRLTAVLIPAREGGFVAMNPETGTTTQGDSMETALVNLKEAIELYLEESSVDVYGQP